MIRHLLQLIWNQRKQNAWLWAELLLVSVFLWFLVDYNNLQAVKNSILLSSVNDKKLYGKTGTGRIDDKDVNGWFVGYIETTNNTCFFATNISANSDATGNSAAQITMSILSDMNIWRQ